MRNGNADAAQWVYEEASQAVEWYVIHGGSYGKQKAAYHLRKLADKLDPLRDQSKWCASCVAAIMPKCDKCTLYGGGCTGCHIPWLREKWEEDMMNEPKDTLTDGGDEIIVQDGNGGDTYVFRGSKTYKIVDGKEVLVPNKVDEDAQSKRDTTTSD